MDEAWRVEVTDGDIRAAKTAWLAAVDGGATPERVSLLRRDLESLWRAQGRQIAERFRARGTTRNGGAPA